MYVYKWFDYVFYVSIKFKVETKYFSNDLSKILSSTIYGNIEHLCCKKKIFYISDTYLSKVNNTTLTKFCNSFKLLSNCRYFIDCWVLDCTGPFVFCYKISFVYIFDKSYLFLWYKILYLVSVHVHYKNCSKIMKLYQLCENYFELYIAKKKTTYRTVLTMNTKPNFKIHM